MKPKSKFEHARELADHGFSVIPLKPKSKVPVINWSRYQSQKPTDDDLKQWFANFPERNIGIVTGAVSGLVVVDVDKPEAFHMDMPRTPTVKTVKGWHYYFKHPGFDVGNASLPFGDLRGDGGQVVAPPSTHPSGAVYEWIVSPDEAQLAELPLAIIELASKPSEPNAANDNREVETTAYGKAWLEDIRKLKDTKTGNRNNLLNEVACKAGSLYAAEQLNREEAFAHMLFACRANGLMKEDPKAVDATIRSGWAEGLKNPRYPSEDTLLSSTIHIGPDTSTPSPGVLTFKAASNFKAKPVPWLWEPVLVKGGMTFLAGEAGQGKSTIAFDIVARITNGDRFPASSDRYFEQGRVIYISNEDDPNYTIVPRLTAAGADLDWVLIPDGKAVDEKGERTFDLRADVGAVEAILDQYSDIRLIIIDPFNSYLGKADINDMGQMRTILNPYAELAQKHQVPILFVHHFNKSSGGKASNRMVGSAALRAAARTVYFVERDPIEEDKRILVCDKNNLAKDLVEYRCTIKLMGLGDGIEATYLTWDGERYKRSSDEVISDSQNAPVQRKCIEFIQGLFTESNTDRLDTKAIREAVLEAGFNRDVLYKAKEKLKLVAVSHETDSRLKYWKLPQAA